MRLFSMGSLMQSIGMWLFAAVLCAQNAEPQPPDTQPAPNGVTTPAAALAAIKVPAGFRVSLFAAEPHVRQPISLATDHRGRLWVAECYSYAQREVNFDDKLHDRIVAFEDADHDGQFDKRTVFWDQARRLTSVEVGFGGVWALCPPNLLFIPDRNGDDVPDGEPQVVLDGWNDDAVRHNIANGLRWGPDGWLYGRHGILATSYVGLPGMPPEMRTKINCGVWRFHPTRKVFEAVCHGTTNPWGMDWDENGQLFFINTVIGHLWHVVPGAHFQRMYGEDFNPYLYELIPQTADHFHWDTVEVWSDIRTKGVTPTTDRAGGGHAHCGMLIYQERAWPREYHNTVFTVNLHGLRLNNDRLERHGAGYVAKHAPDFLKTTDPWFRGVELVAGRDGEVYLADWSDIGECHENDGVHRSTGRIYRISSIKDSKDRAPRMAGEDDLSKMPTPMLAEELSGSEWSVRQSRRLLQERAASGEDMKKLQEQWISSFGTLPSDTDRLRRMWALNVTGGATDEWLIAQLSHRSEDVRAWAVRLLCDRGEPSPAAREAFRKMAGDEVSGLVLQFLASSLSQTPAAERFDLAKSLAAHAEFSRDPALPLMVWYGIEPVVLENAARAVDLAVTSKMPKVRQFIVRRLTGDIDHQADIMAQLVADLGRMEKTSAQLDVLRGMSDAMRGWRKAAMPAGWKPVADKLAVANDPDIQRLVRELSVVFGDGRAIEELRKIATAGDADLESRRSALRGLTAAKADGIVELLKNLIRERDLQADAIRGLAAFHDAQTPGILIENYSRLNGSAQPEAMATLVARPDYAQTLLAAVAAKKLDRSAVTPFHVRQLQSLGNESINQSVEELWPELRGLSAEKSRQMAKYRERLRPERLASANHANGRELFQRACLNCHVLFGRGGKVGPDLTGAQRSNLNYLLENIVDPSATVAENFRMSTVIVDDGRVINGIVGEKTDKTMTILTPTDRIIVQNDEVEEIRSSALSIMPEGQLDVLTDDQVRDLIGFLMTAGSPTAPQ